MSACKNNDNTQENKTIDKAILYNIPLDEGLDYEDQENYDITVLVKLNLEQLCVQDIYAINDEQLAEKRSIAKEYYKQHNDDAVAAIGLADFNYDVSYYAPFFEIVFDDLSKYENSKDELITKLKLSDAVENITVNYIGFDEATVNSSLASSNYPFANAMTDIGISTLTYTGNGIKIGTLECGSPDSILNLKTGKYTMLASATTTHSTWVTSIIGGNTGIAEDVYFYCAGLQGSIFTTRVNQLIDTYGVNIINMSYQTTTTGYYDYYCAYIDDIVNNSSCTFIKSAGNNGPGTAPAISSPGCGMNIITVGSIASDRNVSYFSSWYTSSSFLLKPDMVAPGERITNIPNLSGEKNGTSFSTPMVTGIVALLMEEFPALKYNPSLVKSALHNGCIKLPSQVDYFDEQCGFGLVNYQNARNYLSNSQYNNFNIPTTGLNGDIIASYNVTIPAKTEISINANWVINSTNVTPGSSSYTPAYTKCYLKIYDISNSVYIKSVSKNSNTGFLEYMNSSSNSKLCRIDIVINGIKATGGVEAGSFVYSFSHTHNYTYTWQNYMKHNATCTCGDSHLEMHITNGVPISPGSPYSQCLLCGGLALVTINSPGNINDDNLFNIENVKYTPYIYKDVEKRKKYIN